jgi:hypothetical protein
MFVCQLHRKFDPQLFLPHMQWLQSTRGQQNRPRLQPQNIFEGEKGDETTQADQEGTWSIQRGSSIDIEPVMTQLILLPIFVRRLGHLGSEQLIDFDTKGKNLFEITEDPIRSFLELLNENHSI